MDCSRLHVPQGAESLTIMRVVVKQNFSSHMAKMLVQDIFKAIEALEKHRILVDTAMSSPKAKNKHFKDIVHSLQVNVSHQKSCPTTHGVC